MTRTSLTLASFALALLSAPAPSGPQGNGSAVGDPAPEISAPDWFNQLGVEPTLASLRGRAVLIEFWATW